MAKNIFYIEKELGAYVTDMYPLVKLNTQIELLQEHIKEEKRQINKSKRK